MNHKQLLDANMVPEWRNKYLDYHGLDAALNKAIESKNMKVRRKGVDMYFELIKFNQKFANYFSQQCQAQLDKINGFHKEKLNEMKGKFNNLNDQLEQVLSSAIYRDIQPNLHSCSKPHHIPTSACQMRENELRNSSTVSSISDLFRNLRGKESTSPDGGTLHDIRCCTHGQKSEHPSIANLFPRMSRRLSTSPIFNSRDKSPNRRESANLHLRAGKEKMTVMTRRLSQSLHNSANKISSNLTSLSNTLSQTNGMSPYSSSAGAKSHHEIPFVQPLNPNQEIGSMDCSTLKRRLRNRIQSLHDLSAVSSLSKNKIIATYKKKLSNLKFAFRELYFNLVLFEQYTQLNHNGFQQILRKHDRLFASSLGRKFYEEHVQTADFYNDLQAIDQLLENVEHIYTLHFENGNRRRAIEKLQVPTNVYEPTTPKMSFRVGYEFGMFTILAIAVLLVGITSDTGYDWRTVFRLYRPPLILIVFLFQSGISIIIWKHYKINHVLIFELNPRDNLSSQHFIEFGSQLGIIWAISVLLFLFSDHFDVKPSIFPLFVMLIIIMYLLNPTQTGNVQARFWLMRRLGRIFIAPFAPGRVRFADFWLADQLVSIVPLFLDLEYLFCYYTTDDDVLSRVHLLPYYADRCVTRNPQDLVIRTIFAALPAWFRCAQCLRRWRDENWLPMHLANAGKYWCMVMVVVLSSISQYHKTSFDLDTMRIVWIVAAVFTSSLTAWWDIIYDFGLFHKYDKDDGKDDATPSNSTETFDSEDFWIDSKKKYSRNYPFLRKELVYPVWVYYFAIIENIILRFGWIISISLTEFSGIEAGLVVSLLAPLEMFRRFVWNCIRLENEQLNNCGLFRAVRDIPMEVVAPIDESHLDKIIMMMDSRDGPSMRNRLMKRRTLRPDRVSFMVLQSPDTMQSITRRCDVRS